jgi:SSS family solute:Na+ symporter
MESKFMPPDASPDCTMSASAVTVISLVTARNKSDEELKGLVYSLTPKPKSENEPWYQQPVTLGVIVLAVTVLLNIIFW